MASRKRSSSGGSSFAIDDTLKPAAGETQMTPEEAAKYLREVFSRPADQGVPETVNTHPSGISGFFTRAGDMMSPLGGETDDSKANRDEELIAKLAKLLPAEARYKSVIDRMDRRALYAKVMSADPGADAKEVNGIEFTPEERQRAADWFWQNQQVATTAAQATVATRGISGDAEVRAAIDESVNAWRSGGANVLRASPTAVATAAAANPELAAQAGKAPATGGGSTPSFDDFSKNVLGGALDGSTKQAFLTDQDIQQMFRLATSDLAGVNAYVAAVADYRTNNDPNYQETFRVAAGTPPPGIPGPTTGKRFPSRQGALQASKGYTITQAKDLLFGMSKEEIAKVQKLLMQSGYFIAANGEQGAEPMFRGDATDENTQRAWMKLIGDSIKSGQPMFDTLAAKAAEAGEKYLTVDGRPAKDIVLTDATAIRSSSDTLGQSQLGRKLTDEEHTQLVEFIHGLEKRSATAVDAEGSQTVEQVDVNAQIADYLDRTFQTEAQSHDIADQYAEFSQMLAGPTGGR